MQISGSSSCISGGYPVGTIYLLLYSRPFFFYHQCSHHACNWSGPFGAGRLRTTSYAVIIVFLGFTRPRGYAEINSTRAHDSMGGNTSQEEGLGW